jgi:hypothetical protein
MQEGARDLAIALNLGRAEEALHRLGADGALAPQDREFFDPVVELFLDAADGYRSASVAIHGGRFQPPRAAALRAMRLVLPLVREEAGGEDPTVYLEKCAGLAREVAAGASPSPDTRARLMSLLKRLALLAGGEGLDALESKPAALSFPTLSRVA